MQFVVSTIFVFYPNRLHQERVIKGATSFSPKGKSQVAVRDTATRCTM